MMPSSSPKMLVSATSSVSTIAMIGGDDEGAHDREEADGRVLAADEGVGALLDRAAHVLHGLRALVAREHVACQPDREDDRRDAGDGDDPVRDISHGQSEAS